MFKTRLLSGIVLVAIAVASVAAGGPILFAVLLAISLIGVGELYRAMEVHQKGFGALEIAGYVGTVLYYLSLLWVKTDEFSMMIYCLPLYSLCVSMCLRIQNIEQNRLWHLIRHFLCCGYAVLYL